MDAPKREAGREDRRNASCPFVRTGTAVHEQRASRFGETVAKVILATIYVGSSQLRESACTTQLIQSLGVTVRKITTRVYSTRQLNAELSRALLRCPDGAQVVRCRGSRPRPARRTCEAGRTPGGVQASLRCRPATRGKRRWACT